ncbi:MAG: Endonuclease/exonuclease/phosphatase family protein [uncultured Sulfurovum sp.]|uniref:Endonuclease/exonuclease/phosphatase family protein n=1 Tax=uncultured Sulfurovum sp. TaxID=269237 RepID=A0A6S6TEK8_9BACT|nr:MAG: Endonuclease/exonuclease/phosphatase family protein [uncultured Sulfurovum sp.]
MKIKLGTFNLFQFVEPPYAWYTKKEKFTEEQWHQKTTWIKSQIVQMDCDIIGFQEVFSRDALEALVNELGFNYFETVDVAKLNNKTYFSTTVAIASKYPITKIQRVKVNIPSFKKHNFVGHYGFARVPIKATITLPNNAELLVYVGHLKSNRLNEYEYLFNKEHDLEHKQKVVAKALEGTKTTSLHQRLCEASSLFVNMKRVKSKSMVLLCDFNDKEFSLTIDALSNHRYHDSKSEEGLLLADASYYYKEEVLNPHPEAKEPQRKPTSYFLGRGNVLDYIFVSNNLIQNITNYKVLDQHLEKNREGSLLMSDHAQVVCELTFI